MEHSFNTMAAQEVGLIPAVLLNHIYFWVTKNKADGCNCYDNQYWTSRIIGSTTVQVLVDLNGIKNKNLIYVGQKIKYPTTKGFVKGCRVRVKKTAERYATGEKIASFVKGSTYTVIQVGSGKCLLSGIMSWVKNEDLSLL